MEEKDIAIQIENVKKRYRLGVIGGGTLRGDLQSWWARVRKKEDPNSKIGSKTYGKNETFMALDGIDLTVKKGERLGIIGHNGAGKSTLLKLLSRVTGPTDGEIRIDGRISSMLEVGTGFNGELTGRENIYLNGAILGMTKAEVDGKIDKIIEFSECGQFIDTPVKRYSSGMYVKLAFSVAAHLDSEILIMDEVLAVGDMAFQKKCIEKMSQVSQDEGRTILYVSHNMNTIRQLCDRVVVMDHGKIIFNGDVEEGIGIYLQSDKQEKVLSVDFDKVERDRDYLGKDARLKYFEFLDKDEPIYKCGEKIRFRLKWECKVKGFDYRLLIPIKSDSGIIAGTTVSEVINDKNDNPLHDDVFEISTNNLIDDDYNFIIALYAVNEFGEEHMCDYSMVRIRFKLTEFAPEIKWTKIFWSNIRLDDIKKVTE